MIIIVPRHAALLANRAIVVSSFLMTVHGDSDDSGPMVCFFSSLHGTCGGIHPYLFDRFEDPGGKFDSKCIELE
jgi:hypothetical protein